MNPLAILKGTHFVWFSFLFSDLSSDLSGIMQKLSKSLWPLCPTAPLRVWAVNMDTTWLQHSSGLYQSLLSQAISPELNFFPEKLSVGLEHSQRTLSCIRDMVCAWQMFLSTSSSQMGAYMTWKPISGAGGLLKSIPSVGRAVPVA